MHAPVTLEVYGGSNIGGEKAETRHQDIELAKDPAEAPSADVRKNRIPDRRDALNPWSTPGDRAEYSRIGSHRFQRGTPILLPCFGSFSRSVMRPADTTYRRKETKAKIDADRMAGVSGIPYYSLSPLGGGK